MSVKRLCDQCKSEVKMTWGKNKDVICKSDHFICEKCRRKPFLKGLLSIFNPINLFILPLNVFAANGIDPIKYKKKCPICGSKFRSISKSDTDKHK